MIKDIDIITHGEKFNEIIRKYRFDDPEKAEDISKYLTDKKSKDKVSAQEFAKLFVVTEDEAEIFLSFIQRGIEFKESQKRFSNK